MKHWPKQIGGSKLKVGEVTWKRLRAEQHRCLVQQKKQATYILDIYHQISCYKSWNSNALWKDWDWSWRLHTFFYAARLIASWLGKVYDLESKLLETKSVAWEHLNLLRFDVYTFILCIYIFVYFVYSEISYMYIHYIHDTLHTWYTGWWFQPIWKILVKLDHFPK